jgi:hypothetical protein
VWLERDRHSFGILLARTGEHLAQYMRVCPMNPIEIPNADDRGTEVTRNFVELAKQPHVAISPPSTPRARRIKEISSLGDLGVLGGEFLS